MSNLFRTLGSISKLLKHVLENEIPKSPFRTTVGKLELSTTETFDLGWETAICYQNNWYPVERYIDIAEAEIGHYQWCEKAKTMTEIPMLGAYMYGAEDQIIQIKP